MSKQFQLVNPFHPKGDQPKAIERLVEEGRGEAVSDVARRNGYLNSEKRTK